MLKILREFLYLKLNDKMVLQTTIYNILSLCILVNGSITAAISSQQQLKLEQITSGSTSNDNTKNQASKFIPKIITDKKKIFCEEKICTIVHNFTLTDINALDCNDRFLSIQFEITNSVVAIGFLDSNANEIFLKQNKSDICLKIKRLVV